MTEAIIGSAIADDHEHAGYNGNGGLDGSNDGQVLRYDNTFGDFGVAVSYEMASPASAAVAGTVIVDSNGDTHTTGAVAAVAAGSDAVGLGLRYTADLGGASVALGLGYQENDTTDIVGISAKTSISGFDVIVNYSDTNAGLEHVGLAVGYTMGDLLLAANWGEYSLGASSISGFGLVANYDLGGGAKVLAAYGDSDILGVSVDTFSLGLALSF
jgi:outer membrane protein OmpU